MARQSTAGSIDEYIARFPPATRAALEELRALIRAAAPGATETISYAIPTFDLHGKHLVHFAGWKEHVGFYPVPSAMEAFAEDLAPYKSGKGSAQFPLGQPLPEDLIRRIVEFRVGEITAKAGRRRAGPRATGPRPAARREHRVSPWQRQGVSVASTEPWRGGPSCRQARPG